MKTALLALLALSVAQIARAVAPVDLGAPSSSTPYDAYMSPVKNVLHQLNGEENSMERVRELMRIGRNFRYAFTNPYVASSPEKTAATRTGDCKDKALWLANQLNDSNVRFVIGKARRSSKMSHAWLYWKDQNNRWWILDCTNLREPVAADRVSSSEYIAFYSFSRQGTYRHGSTQLLAAQGVAASVASQTNAR